MANRTLPPGEIYVLISIDSIMCNEARGEVIYFSFPFHSNQNLPGVLDVLHILCSWMM